MPLGTPKRYSQFHCPKSKISKVWFALEEDKKYGLGPYLKLVLYILLLDNFSYLEIKCVIRTPFDPAEKNLSEYLQAD